MNVTKLSKKGNKQNNGITSKGAMMFYLLFFIILMHMPFVFAKSMDAGSVAFIPKSEKPVIAESVETKADVEGNYIDSMYEALELNDLGLSEKVFQYAIKGFHYLQQNGKLAKDDILSIADFSQPSSKKRLFVIDMNSGDVLYNTFVAHGVNSGKEYAKQFSNAPASYKSSLGFYETLGTYMGGNGYSLRLEGLERGINDNANRRDIVIHGAGYANESLVRAQGYLGRSWGCPALPEKLSKPIIDKIKNGSCFFIYSTEASYLQKSKIINA
ncbi:MAG: murein L,D-transpeptidase catalytic domain family protein [Chitinophagaceae bacterium]|nr:murein L,D-transpeptidase catalytic domain family protein [Chitinophagaceae bacterium]